MAKAEAKARGSSFLESKLVSGERERRRNDEYQNIISFNCNFTNFRYKDLEYKVARRIVGAYHRDTNFQLKGTLTHHSFSRHIMQSRHLHCRITHACKRAYMYVYIYIHLDNVNHTSIVTNTNTLTISRIPKCVGHPTTCRESKKRNRDSFTILVMKILARRSLMAVENGSKIRG